VTFGVYIHYPYCARHCPYCDFNVVVTDSVPHAAYRDAVLAELKVRSKAYFGRPPVHSIYFGGGTPGMWPAHYIGDLIHEVREQLGMTADAEVTVEFNPEDADRSKFDALVSCGVNRISLGVQSFDDASLEFLGRRHRSEDASHAVEYARQAGIDNMSLDLIHGMAGQTLAEAIDDVSRAAELGPDHLSTYQLTIENKTPFGARQRRGETLLSGDPHLLSMFEGIRSALQGHGYTPYEISSAAREGRTSRHNTLYWTGAEFMGLGAGAHGFRRTGDDGQRYENTRHPVRYMAAAMAGEPETTFCDHIDSADLVEEMIMTGLRMDRGVLVTPEMRGRYGSSAGRLINLGLLTDNGNYWAATIRGRAILDSVVLELVAG
jgi:putative oxygen-independent coproporphyrinogen III oxidase